MAVEGGASQRRKQLATQAGLSTAQSVALSGADLEQKAKSVVTGQAIGPGIDGARMTQIEGGTGT